MPSGSSKSSVSHIITPFCSSCKSIVTILFIDIILDSSVSLSSIQLIERVERKEDGLSKKTQIESILDSGQTVFALWRNDGRYLTISNRHSSYCHSNVQLFQASHTYRLLHIVCEIVRFHQ